MNAFEQHGLGHLSASSCNLFAAEPAMWVMEKLLGRKSSVGAAAHRGSASERGIEWGLYHREADLDECVQIALKDFRQRCVLNTDPRMEKEEAGIPGIVEQGLEELRPYGPPTRTQNKISFEHESVAVPFIGYVDFLWDNHGILIDLKTQLRLSSQISIAHARQVSLYKGAISNNLDTRIAYVTPKKRAVYGLENHQTHISSLVKIAMTIERFLSVSCDAQELAALMVPNFESFYWNSPDARRNGFEVWGF